MKMVILWFISLYQKILSPDHSFWAKCRYPHGFCRFYPSCSEYSRATIEKRGWVVGSCRALWRIIRCNPWSRGGVDLP